MKTIIRHYIIDTLSLFLISLITTGLIFDKWPQGLFLAGLGLMATTLLIKPIVNILLIPLNLLTFGIFKWISSAVALYIVTLIVPGFKILYFSFAGLSSKWLDIPSFTVSGVLAYIAFSFILSFFTSIIYWLIK